jgi:hypothetical protein
MTRAQLVELVENVMIGGLGWSLGLLTGVMLRWRQRER